MEPQQQEQQQEPTIIEENMYDYSGVEMTSREIKNPIELRDSLNFEKPVAHLEADERSPLHFLRGYQEEPDLTTELFHKFYIKALSEEKKKSRAKSAEALKSAPCNEDMPQEPHRNQSCAVLSLA